MRSSWRSGWLLGAMGFSLLATGAEDPLQSQLNPQQFKDVTERLERFYQAVTPEQLQSTINVKVPKYDRKTGQVVERNQFLRLDRQHAREEVQQELEREGINQAPLLQHAQAKLSTQFLRHECIAFKKQQGKTLEIARQECRNTLRGRAGVEPNDRVENLLETWTNKPIKSLDEIQRLKLTSGESEIDLWSDDYWRLAWGATSFRYGNSRQPDTSNYLKAVTSFLQPNLWNSNEQGMEWSPSEKYDISVGDVGDGKNIRNDLTDAGQFARIPGFTLTRHQKLEGWDYWSTSGKVEEWMGICHGWAPAAIIVPKPNLGVDVKGADGTKVHWHAHDIRAMASLAWANARVPTNFVGGRCNAKEPRLLANGRIAQQECFDNNPATFHLALVNLVGKLKQSFVMDKTFDYEVWNQPIHSYELTYFNPLNHNERSKKWSDVAISYKKTTAEGKEFAKVDRFRKPNTRGKTARGNREAKIEKVVGVVATVRYLVEVGPTTGEPSEDAIDEVTYTYDLELYKDSSGKLIADGGEWHENTHPDFLWVPQKGLIAKHAIDSVALGYRGTANEKTLAGATRASQAGYPLCQVLSHLVEKSSGKKYPCR